MFKCNCKNLEISFNSFHDIEEKVTPEYGEYCLLELKDGRFTAGQWYPQDYKKKVMKGEFANGTSVAMKVSEVAKWHSLDRYDLSECLEDAEMEYIDVGHKEDDTYAVIFKNFRRLLARSLPKEDQFCLLILKNGGFAAGRWEGFGNSDGCFIYASALASHSKDEVWAWTPLSSDPIFESTMEEEKERKREKRLNKNPSVDPELFKYGTDIDVYYEKARDILKKKYPWASVPQMRKEPKWEILPLHGKLVFGQDEGTVLNSRIINEWKDGKTGDEFIAFLCGYTDNAVKNSDPEKKFKFGYDINVYLNKAFDNVKKDYHWLNKKMVGTYNRYEIKQIDGDWEFVSVYFESGSEYVLDCSSSEDFINAVEHDYKETALRENKVVASFDVKFKPVEIHGWHLERYTVSKLMSGDYKVNVTAGDRVAGGSREFFITPDCFKAKTYDEFLDRYQEIVPGRSFGLTKDDLMKDEKLKKFFGYGE